MFLAALLSCGCGETGAGGDAPEAIYQSLQKSPASAVPHLRRLADLGASGFKVLGRLVLERNDDLALETIKVLSESNSNEALDPLIHALGGSSEVRWAARQALEAKGDLAALALMRVVRSSEAAMASDAAAALTGFAVHAPRQLLPFLEESLHHKLWDVRYCGLWGLRFYGKQASFAAPSVRALLNDPTANVAMMARETLAVIQ